MTVSALMAKLKPFKGRQLIDCVDAITSVAADRGYSLNVIDPTFNVLSIDREPRRLNVHTDDNSLIVSFSVG